MHRVLRAFPLIHNNVIVQEAALEHREAVPDQLIAKSWARPGRLSVETEGLICDERHPAQLPLCSSDVLVFGADPA